MNDAGKIMLTPKGTYDELTLYDFLDAVVYDGSCYVAKKSTQGNTPNEDDTEHWTILVKGIDADFKIATVNSVGVIKPDGTTITITEDGKISSVLTETDPTVPSHVKNITATNIADWNSTNSKVNTVTNLVGNSTLVTESNTITGAINELYERDITLYSSTGDSETGTMTQKAITDLYDSVTDDLEEKLNKKCGWVEELETEDTIPRDADLLGGLYSASDITEFMEDTTEILGEKVNIESGKIELGLENVDNTSDINKPISNLTQNALNTKPGFLEVSEVNDISSTN